GGVTPASATAVCADTAVPAAEIPELLAALVDRSLLQLAAEPGRYRMLESLREYGTGRLAETGALGTARDLAAGHFAALLARYDPQLRGPGQLTALRVIGAEYDNVLAALRRRCDTGDAPGALSLALDLTWYWHMFGRHADAASWLGEALAVPGGPAPARDCAHAFHLINRAGAWPAPAAGEAAEDRATMRELAARLLAYPEVPGPYGPLTAIALAFLQEEKSAPAVLDHLVDGGDVWLAGLARTFRAEFAENAGELDRVRPDVEAALACFRRAGDRWGQATVLPLRAQLRQYDGDLDGALADLREARSLAAEFGRLSLGDEMFIDLRWMDLHLRRGDAGAAIAVIASARERVRRAGSPPALALIDAWEALSRAELGDQDRARELIEDADRALDGDPAFPGLHARTLAGCARIALRLALGDPAGAESALEDAYAVALRTRDLPILAVVAVHAAAVAEAYGHRHESVVLLGAASRLRGAHDRTDPRIRGLTRRARAALGEERFAAAYTKGWELDGRTAAAEVDPARRRRELRAGPGAVRGRGAR
ncbi:ATP-binding protein, partial [Pseudosporangium ferrugineum]